MIIEIKTDFSSQMRKSAILKNVPRAFKRNATGWATETYKYIKTKNQGGGGSFMSFKRPPKEAMARLDQKVIVTGAESAQILIGTGGYVGLREVVYAKIQDEGGVVKAKDKFFSIANIKGRPAIGPFLSIPIGNAKHRIDYRGKGLFNIRTKSGNFISVMKTGRGGLKPLFALKSQVTLNARHWFTGPINQRRPILDATMTPEAVWITATALADQGRGGS